MTVDRETERRGSLGVEWIVDARECDSSALRDVGRIEGTLDYIVGALSLHPVKPLVTHSFPGPGGITALLLLSESHLTVHTYPELAAATFNLYCCRPRPDLDWAGVLRDWIDARDVRVRRLSRGDESPRGEPLRGVGRDHLQSEGVPPGKEHR